MVRILLRWGCLLATQRQMVPSLPMLPKRALAAGVSTRDALNMIAKFRQTNQTTPVLVMGYLNPVEIIGYDNLLICVLMLALMQF